MAVRLNLGCGTNYKTGWINVDFNKGVKADKYVNLTKKLPWKDNSVDEVLMDNVLEHIGKDQYFKFMEELWRVCKKDAKIKIYVPHYSGMYALKHPTHFNFFGIGSFDTMRPEEGFNGERYTNARFHLSEEKLYFFHHNLVNMKFLSKLPINWFFNFGRAWQMLMERFQPFGFDEMYFELKPYKEE